jgi:PilZ domain
MDQRREPRFTTNQPVSLTVLGPREIRISGTVRNVSGRGLGLELPVEISPGAALKIELQDEIVLAEAVFCRKDGAGYFAGIALEQVLSGLAELGRVLRDFQDSPLRRETVNALQH